MNILITGKNSYIGMCLRTHLEQFGHQVAELNTIGDEWKTVDYSVYDAIVHVAAIVHNDAATASEELFYKVNTKLPEDIAILAKQQGVAQFVFLSTMAVFGVDKTLSESHFVVTSKTSTAPTSLYGKSKLAAEKRLRDLEDDNYKVAIVRPPNVYGPHCRGNYIYLFKKLAMLLWLCPHAFTNIKQSMLYIDNLSEIIRLIIENQTNGTYMPQDDHIPSTVDLITAIRSAYGKRTHNSKLLGTLLKPLKKLGIINKLYGGVCYDEELSKAFDMRYQIVSFQDGIKKTYQDM